MAVKVFALLALVSVVKAGYLPNNQVQIQSNSYSNAISHPVPAPAPAPHSVIYDHVPSVATSSVHVATATADSGHVVVSQAAPAQLYNTAPAPVIEASHAQLLHAPAVIQTRVEPYDPNPHYTYGYDINDPNTGDSKNQQETRTGDVVHGHYSLTDPDGSRRTVDYSAGPHTGFNAVVRRTGLHPAPAVNHPTYIGH